MASKLQQSETLRETCRTLYMEGFTTSKIGEQTGVNPETVKTWATRFKWKADKARAMQTLATVVRASVQTEAKSAENEISLIGNSLRLELARKLQKQVNQLDDIKPLNNVGQGRAGVSKTLTEASSLVFGWRDEQPEVQVHFHALGARPANVIEVKSVVETPQEPKE